MIFKFIPFTAFLIAGCATAPTQVGGAGTSEGTARASVDGRGNCTITETSGNADLDRKTCDLFSECVRKFGLRGLHGCAPASRRLDERKPPNAQD